MKALDKYPSNRVLLHILKNNPQNGEVYITWEGETFVGKINSVEITRRIDEPAMFSISGYIQDKENQ
jgi:hypothetical protein